MTVVAAGAATSQVGYATAYWSGAVQLSFYEIRD
jgi:hypothetical protein